MNRTFRILATATFAALAGCPGGGGSPPGPATAAVREAEPNDDAAAATPVGADFPARAAGALSDPADRDHFRIEAPGPGFLSVEFGGPGGPPNLKARDPAGRLLATARGARRLVHRFDRAAPLVVEVARPDGPGAEYELSFAFAPAPKPPPAGPVGPMHRPRVYHAAVGLPDGGAIVGGGAADASSPAMSLLRALPSTELFDAATGRFVEGPNLGSARFGPTATLLPDGRVLFAGGDAGGTSALYDPVRGAMERTDLPIAGGGRFLHTATLLPDGRVLVAGGYRLSIESGPRAVRRADTAVFDPARLEWTEGPALRAARVSHAATLLPDGRVLLTGGEGRPDSEIVSLAAGREGSAPGPALTGVRDDHSATLLADGRILVAGGQTAGGESVATAEILDPPGPDGALPAAFRPLAARLREARSDHLAALAPDGTVLLLGGEQDDGTGRDRLLASVERFRPATEDFVPAFDLAEPRDDARVAVLPGGWILVTGGCDAAGKGVSGAELLPLP